MASEKFIAANAHFEKLEKFFEEYPDGKPVEGGQVRQEPHDESDWEDWERQRHSAFDDELQEWKKRNSKIEHEKAVSRESFRRSKLVRNCRVGLVLMTVIMWWGWYSQNAHLNKQIADLQDKRLQGLGSDPLWSAKMERVREREGFINPEEKIKEMPGKIFLLLIWTAGAGWVLFSAKGRGLAEKYLSEGREISS